MARLRQSTGASGVRKVPQSLWERAGARAGNGAGALFARLDAQDARDALEATAAARPGPDPEQAARTLERLAMRVRAGEWGAELRALVETAEQLLDASTDRQG